MKSESSRIGNTGKALAQSNPGKSGKAGISGKSRGLLSALPAIHALRALPVLPALLALAVAFGLFAALPTAASADSADKLADTINDYAYFGSGALTAEASGNTVTITGTATSGGRVPSLNFDAGVTVIWRADYTSSEINAITIGGEGFFELPAGGSITNTGSGYAVVVGNSAVMTVTVSGGEIRSEGGGINGGTKGAIINVSGGLVEARSNAISGQRANVHISGGLVTSSEGSAVSNIGDGSSVTVSGGEARSVDSVAIGSVDVTISGGLVENADMGYQTISASGSLTMTGGTVRNPSATLRTGQPGGGSALIVTGNCICDISGGELSAKAGTAINNNGVNYNINVRGGFVFAYGTSIIRGSLEPVESSVLVPGSTYPTTVGGEAVVCAWNQAAGRATYNEGSADDLVAEPSGASAVWGIEGGVSGIKYANGANTGFFALSEVTVVPSGSEPVETPDATPEPTPPPSATPAPTPPSGSLWGDASIWALPELEKAAELGLIPESLYGTDLTQPITRAEFAAVSVKVYESLSGQAAEPARPNPFTDTGDIEVLKAYNVGITAGTSATTFEPNTLLNREQAATMLTRVYKRIAIDGWTLDSDADFPLPYTRQAPFSDDALISDWARDSVYFMVSKGIINGFGNNVFGPRNTTSAEEAANYASATREQALLIATRMAENLS